jgi:hypothetical protein
MQTAASDFCDVSESTELHWNLAPQIKHWFNYSRDEMDRSGQTFGFFYVN